MKGPGQPDSDPEERKGKRDLIFKRNYRKSFLEKKLDEKLKSACPEGKLCQAVSSLLNDPLVASMQNYANVVSIQRLGYNDHGPVHARIVALNSLRILDLLNKGGVHLLLFLKKWPPMTTPRWPCLPGLFFTIWGCRSPATITSATA